MKGGALLFGCCDTLWRLTLDRLYPAHPARSVPVVGDESTKPSPSNLRNILDLRAVKSGRRLLTPGRSGLSIMYLCRVVTPSNTHKVST